MAKKSKKTVDEELDDDIEVMEDLPTKDKKNKKLKKEKKGKGFLVFLIIFILICGLFLVAVFLDLFNLRTVYFNNFISKIPFFSQFAITTEEEPEITYEEILSQNNILTLENEDLVNQILELEEVNENLIEENLRLSEFENNQMEFIAEKEAFDIMVANGEPYDYTAYYESINPVTADEIYRELKGIEMETVELDDYISRYKNMKPSNTALILEELMATDMDLVALILENLDSDTAGKIISAMSAENGAKITKRMAP